MNRVLTAGRDRSEEPRTTVALTVGSTVAAAVVLLVTVVGLGRFFDRGVYHGAGRHWLIDGGELYAFRYQDTKFGFTYPPFAALVMSPFAVLSWPAAIVAATVSTVGALALLLRWFLAPILRKHSWAVWSWCALAFCALLVFEPVRTTIKLGQINLVLLALVCFDHRALRGGRWAGIGIGIAAAIKLVPAVFIGYLVVTRQYRAAATASGTAIAATLLSWVVAPGPSQVFWTAAVWDTDRVGQLATVYNQSTR
ncbi:MAG TPA: glycosyltransferase family 87 protein, partial [Actinoplanes sp.]|nr:glycosyltransferase family 87 protein [Actinoplanes sp.]